jgi:hypothetical protein
MEGLLLTRKIRRGFSGVTTVSALAAILLCALPCLAHAQLFLASHPNPPFTIGPLFVRASITPQLGPVPIDVFWGLEFPPGRRAGAAGADLYLLWPNAVTGEAKAEKPDPELARSIEAHGFTITGQGRMRLLAQSVLRMGRDQHPEPIGGGAPYVTFVRQGGPLGVTAPATYIRIPWTPKLADREWLMHLQLIAPNPIKPIRASWIETLVGGQRHVLSISFNEMRGRALFPLYLENRDRVVHLAEEPAQLLVTFSNADRLKINEISPPSASRHPSEAREHTEIVSLFLDQGEGITPQVLTVQFGYFSRIQAWGPILLPTLFFVLGNLAAVFVRTAADRLKKRFAGRVLFGPARQERRDRQTGVILSRATLESIAPGVTTYEQVLQLCGPDLEQVERLPLSDRRTLVYRGQRVVPQRWRTFGWLTTVRGWGVEHHEVEIELEHDVVRDVRAHVRRTRLDRFEPT